MSSGIRPYVLLLATVTCLLGGVCHGFNQQTANEMTNIAFQRSMKSLQQQKFNLRRFHDSGIDSSSSADSYTHQLGIFRAMTDSNLEISEHAFIATRATQELAKLTKLPVTELMTSPIWTVAWRTIMSPICSCKLPVCDPSYPFRTYDGSCNNLKHTRWGISMSPQARFLPPAYLDGINIPRSLSVTGNPLPSVRSISNCMHDSTGIEIFDKELSLMPMQWGQFIDHDFIFTPFMRGHDGTDIMCCNLTAEQLADRCECMPISIPPNDGHFRKCMNFVRSVPAPNAHCDLGYRNQLNQATSYIDASEVYGSSETAARELRLGNGGLLKMGEHGMLPAHDREICVKRTPRDYCFRAGDNRVHVTPGLSAIHTLFVREHNRLATKLHEVNPHWKDERLYQEARKIVAAQHQQINHLEYLPPILGPKFTAKYDILPTPLGHSTCYDPKVDASVTNVFGAAAFRFGHSQVPKMMSLVSRLYAHQKDTLLESNYNKPNLILGNAGFNLENLMRWIVTEGSPDADTLIEGSVRDKLFLDDQGKSFDLAALNLQRGRDHGVPSYNAWRMWCGLKPALHFGPGPGGLCDHAPANAKALAKVYEHVDDIDIFSGGLSEIFLPGGRVGPTFGCILGQQFRNLKVGDRFWYENAFPSGFSVDQLNEIKKTRLSSVMCNTLDIESVQLHTMFVASPSNPRIPCKEIPQIDFRFWAEAGTGQSFNTPPFGLGPTYGIYG